MSGDYGSHTEADAAAYERHYGGGYSDGPDAREVAEMRAEWEADNRAAARAAADALSASSRRGAA